jgi:hypothetical protein
MSQVKVYTMDYNVAYSFIFVSNYRNVRPIGGQDLPADLRVRGRHVSGPERHRHGVSTLSDLRRRHRVQPHPHEARRKVLQ